LITRDEMLPYLVDACPSFAPEWEAFKQRWGEDLQYPALADFAWHLVEKLSNGATADLEAAFAAIERLYAEGDEWVRNAVVVGVLESLQNTNKHSRTNPEQFRPYLGPKSECYWDELYRFWGDGPAREDEEDEER
jgi:hypothetical protein